MRITALEAYGIDDKVVDLWKAAGHNELLPVQEQVIKKHRVLEGHNVLVFSPTSSGKTLVGEMAAVKVARAHGRVLYLVPQKALAEEKFREFEKKYSSLKFEIAISTRDRKTYDARIKDGDFDIAIVVFEKMQNLLVASPTLMEKIRLVVVDELQMIGDPERGAGLELLLAKVKMAKNPPQLIGLSAVLGNSRHLAEWLGAELCETTRRPVELRKGTVLNGEFRYLEHNSGETGVENLAEIDEEADGRRALKALVSSFVAKGEKTIVFCKTRMECIQTALALAREIDGPRAEGAIADVGELEESRGRKILTDLLARGIAYHNADLDWDQRDIIERWFRAGEIKVLCATSTLAMGVNLPARNVIIDPQRWDRDQYGNWTKRDILQAEFENMSGRAGRLGLEEDFGRAMIIVLGKFKEMVFQDVFIRGELENIEPTLDRGDLADHVLNLVASKLCRSHEELKKTLLSSFTGYFRWREGFLRDRFARDLREAIDRCVRAELLQLVEGGALEATELGKVAALKAIPVKTATCLVEFARKYEPIAHDVHTFEILCRIVCNDEGDENYLSLSTEENDSNMYLGMLKEVVDSLPRGPSRRLAGVHKVKRFSYEQNQRVKKTLLLHEWVQDLPTREIEERYFTFTGTIINMAREFSWLAEALCEIAKICGWRDSEVARIKTLAERLIHGVPEGGVGLSGVRVRGLGRARICKLFQAGLVGIEEILKAPAELVEKIVTRPVAERLVHECRKLQEAAENRKKREESAGGGEEVARVDGAAGLEVPLPQVAEAAAPYLADAPPAATNVFRRQGQMWTLAFDGKAAHMGDSKGLAYLAHLIRNQGAEVHVAALAAQVAGKEGALLLGDSGEVLDEEAIRTYRTRLRALEGEAEAAGRSNDPGRREAAVAEADALKSQIAAAVGFRGRARRAAGDAEKIRKAVSLAITRALGNIAESHPELYQHLTDSVKMGMVMAYAPGVRVEWVLE
jgi:replicative superfamily II helicase